MAEILGHKDAQYVLEGKHVAILGGSNMRGLYKDMVWLLNDSSLVPYECLGEKLEKNYPNFEGKRWEKSTIKVSKRLRKIFDKDNVDLLLKGEGLHPGRNYIEPRTYHHKKKNITINYFFTTSCWHEELDEFFRSYEENHGAKLDFLIMNSVLWDTNRWGPFYVENYKKKFGKLIALVKETLSENGQFIWLTNQPGSKFLNSKAMEIPGLVFQKITTRYNVIEANFFAAHRIAEAGYSVIDLHYYFLLQTFRRNRDGIHWAPEGQRYVTNLVLTHLYLQQDKPLPGRNLDDYALERVIMNHDIEKGKYHDTDGQVQHDKIEEQIKILEIIANRVVDHAGRMDLPPVQTLLREGRDKIQRENEAEERKRLEREAEAAAGVGRGRGRGGPPRPAMPPQGFGGRGPPPPVWQNPPGGAPPRW